ncbi:MAG: DnaA regulatory inactivator Hda [Pseudomonadota bacterium]
MQQLLLDLITPSAPTLARFVTGRNVELMSVLQTLRAGQPHERFLYLWGDHGSGKSHLLQALTGEWGTLVSASGSTRMSTSLAESPFLAIDDVDLLSEAGAIDLFNIYNGMREAGGILLVSGPCPPGQLTLRQDLVTRLAWGLVLQVHPLTDEEKIAALQSHAEERCFNLSREVGQYLLTHWRRDMDSLFAALDALDRYSLETKRPITLPLLREAINLSAKRS